MLKPENPVEPFKRAVTAAVRAIARDSELSVNFGAEGTTTGASRNRLPTPSRELGHEEIAHVRGSGDALALWQRHHDNRLHALNQPKGATARAVFEAAEQARVESIGSNRMMGVSGNLDAMLEERCRARGYASVKDPGEALLPEVVGMLVREQLTGKEPPATAKPMVEHIRPWIEKNAGEELRNLTGNITDQNAFAKLTRKLIADLDLGEEDGTESDDLEDNPDNEEEMADGEGEGEGGEGDADDGGDPEGTDSQDGSADGDSEAESEMEAEDADAMSGSEEPGRGRRQWRPGDMLPENPNEPPYRSYTDEFDEFIDIALIVRQQYKSLKISRVGARVVTQTLQGQIGAGGVEQRQRKRMATARSMRAVGDTVIDISQIGQEERLFHGAQIIGVEIGRGRFDYERQGNRLAAQAHVDRPAVVVEQQRQLFQ